MGNRQASPTKSCGSLLAKAALLGCLCLSLPTLSACSISKIGDGYLIGPIRTEDAPRSQTSNPPKEQPVERTKKIFIESDDVYIVTPPTKNSRVEGTAETTSPVVKPQQPLSPPKQKPAETTRPHIPPKQLPPKQQPGPEAQVANLPPLAPPCLERKSNIYDFWTAFTQPNQPRKPQDSADWLNISKILKDVMDRCWSQMTDQLTFAYRRAFLAFFLGTTDQKLASINETLALFRSTRNDESEISSRLKKYSVILRNCKNETALINLFTQAELNYARRNFHQAKADFQQILAGSSRNCPPLKHFARDQLKVVTPFTYRNNS